MLGLEGQLEFLQAPEQCRAAICKLPDDNSLGLAIPSIADVQDFDQGLGSICVRPAAIPKPAAELRKQHLLREAQETIGLRGMQLQKWLFISPQHAFL